MIMTYHYLYTMKYIGALKYILDLTLNTFLFQTNWSLRFYSLPSLHPLWLFSNRSTDKEYLSRIKCSSTKGSVSESMVEKSTVYWHI